MKIHCRYDRLVPISKLKQHPKNPQRHSVSQVELLAKIILKNGWRRPLRVSERSGYITAGHCALAAARLKGWKTVPVDFQPYASDGLELADLSADNELARLAETDEEILAGLLKDLEGEGIDRELAGVLAQLDKMNGELKAHSTRSPPQTTWVLVCVPTVNYGKISGAVGSIGKVKGAIVQTSQSD
jgi:hypothetical protein